MRTDLLRYSLLLIAAWLSTGAYCAAAPGDLLFKITAPDPQPGAAFGRVIAAVDGDILVGEPARLRPGLDAPGRAHLFDGQSGKLKWTFDNPEPTNQDLFGHSLTGGDGRVFISTDGVVPRVYGFDVKSGQLLHKIREPDNPAGGNFGTNVAYGSGSLLISNPSFSVSFERLGRAYLFDANTGQLQRTLPNPDPNSISDFGNGIAPLSVAGDKVIVGTFSADLPGGADRENAGRVWVFDRLGGETTITLENPNPGKGPPNFFSDWFGATVAANERVIAVGAINDDTSGVADSGTVYIFDSKTGALRHTLFSPQLVSRSNFGQSLAVTDDGNVLVGAWWTSVDGVEAGGHAYLFDGLTGNLLLEIPNPEPESFAAFGSGVAAIDGRLVVAADGANLEGLPRTGAVYVFEGIPEPRSLVLVVVLIFGLISIREVRRLVKSRAREMHRIRRVPFHAR